MRIDRREFLFLNTAAAAVAQVPSSPSAVGATEWKAKWICYPGQLAAWRHARRMRLSMQRCAMVGYPANYRQRLSEAYFRKSGKAGRDILLRWTGPIGRIRVTAGGVGGDITRRTAVLPAGGSGIEVQIDFAGGLPCLLLEGEEFSTGPSWEASLDGENWVPAETSGGGDPMQPPDAAPEITVSLPVYRTVEPEGVPRDGYSVSPGRDLLLDFRETELGPFRRERVARPGTRAIRVQRSRPECHLEDRGCDAASRLVTDYQTRLQPLLRGHLAGKGPVVAARHVRPQVRKQSVSRLVGRGARDGDFARRIGH